MTAHPTDKISYSFAGGDHLPGVRQLLAGCGLPHGDITVAHLKHFLLGWDDSDGARLVGTVGLEIIGDRALLRSLAVDPDYRGRKIATGLVGRIEDYARSLKVNTLFLLTMTAEAFFKKCGYRPTARDSAPAGIQETTEFQNLCPVSAACLVKRLGVD